MSLFLIGMFLTGCFNQSELTDALSQDSKDNTRQMYSASSRNIQQTKKIENWPFEIALPERAMVSSAETKYRKKSLRGMEIRSDSEWEDLVTHSTKKDFFYFGWYELTGYVTIDDFMNSLCSERTATNPGFKIYEKWKQNGMDFIDFTVWDCSIFSAAMGRGVLHTFDGKIYIIFLPTGDWGDDSGKYFNAAIRSIRPVRE